MAQNARNIKIVVRLRPFLSQEPQDDTLTVEEGNVVRVVNQRDRSVDFKYTFAATHPASDTQAQLFESSVLPLLPTILTGRNLTIFCYGVTGSGKTWTMQGGTEPDAEGVTPRLVRWLVSEREEREALAAGVKRKGRGRKRKADDEAKMAQRIEIAMECFEIYNEMVFDLLVRERPPSGLPVRENGERKVFVAGLSQQPIESYEDFEGLYAKALTHRSTGATNLNAASSRSHMAISLMVTITSSDAESPEGVRPRTSRVNLVDLAGSENNKLTGNTKERMTESSAINKSLFVLGQVVQALNAGSSRIPYRDSKMTMIMRDALGGTARGVLICNLAPGARFYSDTLSTLTFASRTRTIENRVSINEAGKEGAANSAPAIARVPLGVKSTNVRVAAARVDSGLNKPGLVKGKAPLRRTPTSGAGNGKAPAKPLSGSIVPSDMRRMIREQRPQMTDEELEAKVVELIEKHLREKAREDADLQRVNISRLSGASEASTSAVGGPTFSDEVREHQRRDSDLVARMDLLEKQLAAQRAGSSGLGESHALPALLSPSTKTKTAKACIALARTAEQRGLPGLSEALAHYQQGALYAPQNDKLRARIEEVREAIGRGVNLKQLRALKKKEAAGANLPSPSAADDGEEEPEKPAKRAKSAGKKTKAAKEEDADFAQQDDPAAGPSWIPASDLDEEEIPTSAQPQPQPQPKRKRAVAAKPKLLAVDTDEEQDDGDVYTEPAERPKAKRTKKALPLKKVLRAEEIQRLGEQGSDEPWAADVVDELPSRLKTKESKPTSSYPADDYVDDGAKIREDEKVRSKFDVERFRFDETKAAEQGGTSLARRAVSVEASKGRGKRASDSSAAAGAQAKAPKARGKRKVSEPSASIDLSSLHMPTVRMLPLCPICATRWPASKTGPAKLAHLETCAASAAIEVDLVTELVSSEADRLARVQREEERKKEEERTLLQQVVGVGANGSNGPGATSSGSRSGRLSGDTAGSAAAQPKKKTTTANARKMTSILNARETRAEADAAAQRLLGLGSGSATSQEYEHQDGEEHVFDEPQLPKATQAFGVSKLAQRSGLGAGRGLGLGLATGAGASAGTARKDTFSLAAAAPAKSGPTQPQPRSRAGRTAKVKALQHLDDDPDSGSGSSDGEDDSPIRGGSSTTGKAAGKAAGRTKTKMRSKSKKRVEESDEEEWIPGAAVEGDADDSFVP